MDQKNDQKSDHFLDPKNGNLNRTKAPIGENPSLMMVVFDPPEGVKKWSFWSFLGFFDFCVSKIWPFPFRLSQLWPKSTSLFDPLKSVLSKVNEENNGKWQKRGQKSGFLATFGPPQNDMFQKSSEKTYEIDTKWSKSEKKSKKKCHFWVIFETPKIIILHCRLA